MELAILDPDNSSEMVRESWNKFKIFRNKVNNKKKFDENAFKREKFEKVKDSPASTWRCAKEFMSWKLPGSPTQIVVENILVTKASEIAEHMNNFFVEKVRKIRNGINFVAGSKSEL